LVVETVLSATCSTDQAPICRSTDR
jgi:hypothetical protein